MNFQPFAAIARNASGSPAGNALEQAGVQRTPPRPVVATLMGIATGPNTAVIDWACVIVTTQLTFPVHAPVQRMKRRPGPGEADSGTAEP